MAEAGRDYMTAARSITSAAPLIQRREHRLKNTADSRKALRTFAAGVKARRTELGLTLMDLANAITISKSQMSHIECGDNWPGMAVYVKLCAELKVGVPPLTK